MTARKKASETTNTKPNGKSTRKRKTSNTRQKKQERQTSEPVQETQTPKPKVKPKVKQQSESPHLELARMSYTVVLNAMNQKDMQTKITMPRMIAFIEQKFDAMNMAHLDSVYWAKEIIRAMHGNAVFLRLNPFIKPLAHDSLATP